MSEENSSEENSSESGESSSSEEKEEGQVNGNEYGMLISSMGSKWECFGGDATEVTVGLSSEFLSGLEYSSKLGGILEYSAGACVGYTGNRKYEFIDTQGFMYDKEGLQYFGETQNITTKNSFFHTAGFNDAGQAAYASCESFVDSMSKALLAIHGVISAGGFVAAVANEAGAMPDSENPGMIFVNNIPMVISVIGVLASLYECYTESYKLFITGITANPLVQPNSVVFGSNAMLFTGNVSAAGYSQVRQADGVVTIGGSASPAAGVPSKIPATGIEVEFMYAVPPVSAQITVDGINQIIANAALQTITSEAPVMLSTAATSFTIISGASKIVVTDEGVVISVGGTNFAVSAASISGKIGDTSLSITPAMFAVQMGPTMMSLEAGEITLSAPKITVDGTLSANGVNLSVAP